MNRRKFRSFRTTLVVFWGKYKVTISFSSNGGKLYGLVEFKNEVIRICGLKQLFRFFTHLHMPFSSIWFHLIGNHHILTIDIVSHDFCSQYSSNNVSLIYNLFLTVWTPILMSSPSKLITSLTWRIISIIKNPSSTTAFASFAGYLSLASVIPITT